MMSSPSISNFRIVVCAVFVILAEEGITQQQEKLQQEQQQQDMVTASSKCWLRLVPGGSNGNMVAAGGRIIMEQEPCVGFGPHTDSYKNSRRREGCRKAAYALAQHGARPECGQIVHGQCAKVVDARGVGARGAGNAPAACYVLAKLPSGAFTMRLLKDCADGQRPPDLYAGAQAQQGNAPQSGTAAGQG